MSLRYYPPSKIQSNRKTKGTEFTLNGKPYIGTYYSTFDGKYFTGANPVIGKNQELKRMAIYSGAQYVNSTPMTSQMRSQLANQTGLMQVNYTGTSDMSSVIITTSTRRVPPPKFKGEPTSFFPLPLDVDYAKGSFTRFFVKRLNSSGYITEISEQEFEGINTGKVPYDVSFYHTFKIMWKLTGPLRMKRISQYDTRAGIIDTNQRLVENADKTFLGMKDFIGGKYDKFAKPTE